MHPIFRFVSVLMVSAATLPAAHSQTAPAPAVLLVVGDSLSAEYGLKRGSGWVALLTQRLSEQYPNYQVVNASISGDTTSGGKSRLPSLLTRHQPQIVLLELGSNDALRGLSLAMTQQNLESMTRQIKAAGARPLLVGMQIPPNYGRQYSERFAQVFKDVADKENARLAPFLLDGMATDRAQFQADGIHPNEAAQPALLDNVWPSLEPLLKDQPSAG
ncbi:arylesterase [Bordetella trematum]|uniref:arylesterase n=1 Tax=Bordetella trematum TaxID=123899 RepID=UPI0007C87811